MDDIEFDPGAGLFQLLDINADIKGTAQVSFNTSQQLRTTVTVVDKERNRMGLSIALMVDGKPLAAWDIGVDMEVGQYADVPLVVVDGDQLPVDES